MFFSDLKGEDFAGTFYRKDLQKINQKKIRIEKVIKRKCDKLYVKWKVYDNSFNSWINKKYIVIKNEFFSTLQIYQKQKRSGIRFF